MRIIEHIKMGQDELLQRFRRTCLLGSAGKAPELGLDGMNLYQDAKIALATIETDHLCPTQTYVERPTIGLLQSIYEQLLSYDINIFNLDGGAWIRTSDYPDEWIPVVPPVVETSMADGGLNIICDGMHRTYLARMKDIPIRVVLVQGLPKEIPYYSYPMPHGWADVRPWDAKPAEAHTKTFRWEHGKHRWLYRIYNAENVLPGVQKIRKTPVISSNARENDSTTARYLESDATVPTSYKAS